MKKWTLGIVITLLALGALAGVGFAGYRIGFMQGSRITQAVRIPNNNNNNNAVPPFANRSNRFNQNNMLQFHPGMNDRNFGPGFGINRFPMMRMGRGFGFFSPFQFIWRVVIFGLIIWFFYWLFAKSGLQVSFNRQPAETPKVVEVEASAPPKEKNDKSDK